MSSNDQNIEVEIRALVENPEEVVNVLKKNNATFKHSFSLHDVYFCPKHCSDVSEVEMDEVDSYSMRVRKTNKSGQESATINSKTIISHGDHSAWEEHEVAVDNFGEAVHILMRTEFKPFFELVKTRSHYELDGVEIFVENIQDFGCGIEAEIVTSKDQVEQAKDKIREVLALLGVSEEDIVEKSITNLVMKERAFKQNITF